MTRTSSNPAKAKSATNVVTAMKAFHAAPEMQFEGIVLADGGGGSVEGKRDCVSMAGNRSVVVLVNRTAEWVDGQLECVAGIEGFRIGGGIREKRPPARSRETSLSRTVHRGTH